MMGYGWGMGFTGWLFMGVFWLVVAGLAVWAILALVPNARGSQRVGPDTPEDILDRRFANGDMDTEQYRQAREELAAARAARNPADETPDAAPVPALVDRRP
jgi:putative membrane protein